MNNICMKQMGVLLLEIEPQPPPPMSRGILEVRRKFDAEMMMVRGGGIVVPTYDEWVGFNLLERDEEL